MGALSGPEKAGGGSVQGGGRGAAGARDCRGQGGQNDPRMQQMQQMKCEGSCSQNSREICTESHWGGRWSLLRSHSSDLTQSTPVLLQALCTHCHSFLVVLWTGPVTHFQVCHTSRATHKHPAQDGLKLSVDLSLWSPCLCLPSPGMTGMHHHARFMQGQEWNGRLHEC